MARILEQLPESSIPPWQPATPLARIHELHHSLLALLVDVVTSDGDDVEQGWLKAFGGLLTPDETAMLTLAATAEQRMSRHFNWQAPAEHEPGTEGDGDVGDADLQIPLGDAPVPARGGQPCPPGIAPIKLSIAETTRLAGLARQHAARLITRARLAFALRWSLRRRLHQATARWHHYSARLPAGTG